MESICLLKIDISPELLTKGDKSILLTNGLLTFSKNEFCEKFPQQFYHFSGYRFRKTINYDPGLQKEKENYSIKVENLQIQLFKQYRILILTAIPTAS